MEKINLDNYLQYLNNNFYKEEVTEIINDLNENNYLSKDIVNILNDEYSLNTVCCNNGYFIFKDDIDENSLSFSNLDKLKKQIGFFEITKPSIDFLLNKNINNVMDLLNFDENELYKTEDVNQTLIDEIKNQKKKIIDWLENTENNQQNNDNNFDYTILSCLISKLNLSYRSYNALVNKGIKTIHDLIKLKKFELYSINNLGRKSVNEIINALEKLGIVLLNDKFIYGNDLSLFKSQIDGVLIETLDLSIRSYNCLKRSNINTITELSNMTLESLLKVKNLGRKSCREVIDKLKNIGITLKSEFEDFDDEDDLEYEEDDIEYDEEAAPYNYKRNKPKKKIINKTEEVDYSNPFIKEEVITKQSEINENDNMESTVSYNKEVFSTSSVDEEIITKQSIVRENDNAESTIIKDFEHIDVIEKNESCDASMNEISYNISCLSNNQIVESLNNDINHTIDELSLSNETLLCLEKHNISNYDVIKNYSFDDFYSLKYFGMKQVEEIIDAINKLKEKDNQLVKKNEVAEEKITENEKLININDKLANQDCYVENNEVDCENKIDNSLLDFDTNETKEIEVKDISKHMDYENMLDDILLDLDSKDYNYNNDDVIPIENEQDEDTNNTQDDDLDDFMSFYKNMRK